MAARTGIAAVAIALTLLVIPGQAGGRPAVAAPLTPFRDCTALSDWFTAAAAHDGTPAYDSAGSGANARPSVGGPFRTLPAGSPAFGGDADFAAETAGPGATGTNLAEAGVDEPALLKVDGQRLVSVWEDQLAVIDVSGAPRVLGGLRLPRGSASELIVVGDRALVLGTAWSGGALLDGGSRPGGRPGNPRLQPVLPDTTTAVLTVVDLSDPDRPTVLRTEEIGGTYLSAREHDGVVRVVLQARPALRLPRSPGPFGNGGLDAAAWLPQRTERDRTGAIVTRSPVIDCTQISHPAEPAGVGLLTVLTLDLADPTAPVTDRDGVATDGDVVYASTDRLVVATASGWAGGGPSSTQVHGFEFTERTVTRYVGSGEVPGWILDRWALSAHDGFLRVATTRGADPSALTEATDSVVTVLAETGDGYRTVGSVGGLGRGERVRAVRWFGDVATVVTFRQTDPLYTLDLSDPAAPRVLGELEVPGYSAYLHPLGDGLLLGVGQDATRQGDVLGTQVSTFDLRELAEPALIDTELDARTWSEVESDSRQFTYVPSRRLAVLPVGGPAGSALWSLRVDADGTLTTTGRWAPGPLSWLAHAVPVDEDRLAVLSQEESGPRLTMLGLGELTPLGVVNLR